MTGAGAPSPSARMPVGRTASAGVRVPSARPTLRIERSYQRLGARRVAGMDEVGRGALAGPVSVGVVCVDLDTGSAPTGVRDSKLLSPAQRRALVPRIRAWSAGFAVGHAEAEEIDAIGIIAALRLAGMRALAQLPDPPDLVLLDGSHDWLTAPDEVGLLALARDQATTPPVQTLVKADRRCSSVAAASVLAKVTRDELMVTHAVAHPAYHFVDNKGYAAPEHLLALQHVGPCALHRRSWRLPGVVTDNGDAPGHEGLVG